MNEKIHRICTRLKESFTYGQYSRHAINAVSREIVSSDERKRNEKNTEKQKPVWEASPNVNFTVPHDFNFNDIVCCVRQSFKPKGNLERLSEKFIQTAMEGDVLKIAEILRKGDIHPDVTDSTGFSAMLAAAVSRPFLS